MTLELNGPVVIGVNGPPHSGKTTQIAEGILPRLIPDAILMRPSDMLYKHMRQSGVEDTHLGYQEFKRLKYSRERLIEYATTLRKADCHVFSRMITESFEFKSARVVIIDNIGFHDEIIWYNEHSGLFLLLRLETPFILESIYEKSTYHVFGRPWPGDSRFPCANDVMLTAHDSAQMCLLLAWLTSPQFPHELAGNYNDIRRLWDRYIAPRRESDSTPTD